MKENAPANREYKDSVFTKLFSESETLLPLYNALSQSQYPLDTHIEITTLEGVMFKDRYNDVSFVVDGKLVVLIEHQSTISPNLPLRLMFYLSKIYDNHVEGKSLYSSKLIKIPRPEFIVLYNGVEDFPDEQILKLSDVFHDLPKGHTPNGSLELTVRVLNINKGHNESVVDRSVDLSGYVVLIDEIHKNRKSGMGLKEAISKAVKDCESRNILVDFLKKHGGEVMSMLYKEWNWDEYIAVQREEAAEDGEHRGEHRKAIVAAKNALEMGLSVEQAAKISELSIEEIKSFVVG